MGGGRWDSDLYRSASVTRKSIGAADFGYHEEVKAGRASKVHETLDPKKVAGPSSPFAGQPVRESRDSDEHPNSLAAALVFDDTGSMGKIPRNMQTKLADLMDVIVEKSGIQDIQVLVGAHGDANGDKYPIQMGQFESDNRFDEALRNMILEGGGGGSKEESIELVWKWAADFTSTDCFEKRGKKGYLFTMSDEMPYSTVKARHVQNIFGVGAQVDESTEDVLKRAQAKWNVYHIYCMDGAYPHEHRIHDRWKELLGQNVIWLDDSSTVCEVIAGIISMGEGTTGTSLIDNIEALIDKIGVANPKQQSSVRNALTPLMESRAV